MGFRHLFYTTTNRLRSFWKIILFICLLSLAVSPIILIKNSLLQFFLAALVLLFGLYLNARYLDKRDFLEYGLVFKKETFFHFFFGVLIGSIAILLILWIGKVTGVLSISKRFPPPSMLSLLPFALKMILVGFLEETFFRGYLYTSIYDGFTSKTKKQALLLGLILSSVLFGLAHFNTSNASLLSILFLSINGVIWCIPFILTKNLGLSIGMHAAWNFTQTAIGFTMSGNKASYSFYGIENNGLAIWSGGAYGPEAGILGLIGFMTMLLLSLAYLKRKAKI
ncbi:CPBP family intramembrane metalloprotease [Flagellimonas sp. HMM57]|uniref:CPBP family intramembrane glutamic endopeptidase n=1 Tax=unclassified Flagellimonas TaxID=2644544 RepID=UPI0013D5353F|nr:MULTISPECIES: CPBP family intramembrane glutamic endopeptidase [unclassified Flagellimonas]UII77650.1 CPBP family intramembrane metalloprotease [Flagellimonas sp. HMM57]